MRQQINLYHPIFRKQAKKFSARAMAQASGIVVLGVMLIYAFDAWQTNRLRTQLTQLETERQAAAGRLERLAKNLGAANAKLDIQGEIDRLEAELAARKQVQLLLTQGSLGNTHGYAEHLLSFARQHVPGVWLVGIHITGGGEEVVLKGRSVSPELVPRYMQRLAQETTLAGTEFRVFKMARPEVGEQKKRFAPYVEFRAGTSHAEEREAE